MAFATPNPRPLPKWIALIAPFHIYVWICVVSSVILASIFMFAISNEETRLSGVDLHNWSSMKEAGWYCYGTVIGESITRDTKSEKAVSLR